MPAIHFVFYEYGSTTDGDYHAGFSDFKSFEHAQEYTDSLRKNFKDVKIRVIQGHELDKV